MRYSALLICCFLTTTGIAHQQTITPPRKVSLKPTKITVSPKVNQNSETKLNIAALKELESSQNTVPTLASPASQVQNIFEVRKKLIEIIIKSGDPIKNIRQHLMYLIQLVFIMRNQRDCAEEHESRMKSKKPEPTLSKEDLQFKATELTLDQDIEAFVTNMIKPQYKQGTWVQIMTLLQSLDVTPTIKKNLVGKDSPRSSQLDIISPTSPTETRPVVEYSDQKDQKSQSPVSASPARSPDQKPKGLQGHGSKASRVLVLDPQILNQTPRENVTPRTGATLKVTPRQTITTKNSDSSNGSTGTCGCQ